MRGYPSLFDVGIITSSALMKKNGLCKAAMEAAFCGTVRQTGGGLLAACFASCVLHNIKLLLSMCDSQWGTIDCKIRRGEECHPYLAVNISR